MQDPAPRLALLDGPTPLARLDRLRAALGPDAPELWIKRDDRTPLALGGNKLRKLEWHLGAAQAAGADVVVTTGAAQSNHCAQTAAAACFAGLRCVLLLRGRPELARTGNLRLDTIYGAELELEPEPPADWMSRTLERLRAAGARPHPIPYGGTDAVGALGYRAAGAELAEQCEARGLALSEIVCASSSGGTQAGLVLAVAEGRLRAPVLGVSAELDAAGLEVRVRAAVDAAVERFGLARPPPEALRCDGDFVGPGYGLADARTEEAMRLLARTEGLLVDPVYTGKALAAVVAHVRAGRWSREDRVLFWHTGGAGGLLA